ncbi:SpaH/EbpB family LPXTG-anchored major pilin [Corynebacterium riegelii]|uniref:SpaH/EbpB family LPXTG-anchored major pilin n=1 Tax=Corynebacterium riegelii TaxID=156976 RepID=UPI0023F6A909|nr:SpaH/EbpB family LPXTG-anchored major pilin [Corynebacterium riegelii]
MSKRVIRSLVASVATATLLVGAVPAVPVLAQNPPVAGSPSLGIPAKGDLQIHKIIGLPGNTASNGTVQDVQGEPGKNINFKVSRVGQGGTAIDLTTQDGWNQISGIALKDDGTLSAGFEKVGAEQTQATNDNGLAEFKDLPAGLYLVEEPGGQSADGKAVTPSKPFLVTVPMTNPSGDGWLDTVHVYPKNQVTEVPTKEITGTKEKEGAESMPGLNLGDLVSYAVTATVPVVSTPTTDQDGKQENTTSLPAFFTITDKLPKELGEPTNVKVTFGGTELQDTQFEVKKYQVGDRWVLRVQVKPNALNGNNTVEAKDLKLAFDAELKEVPNTLDNTAWALPDSITEEDWDPENPGDTNPGTPSDGEDTTSPARMNFADIALSKVDANDANTKLENAEFQLHRCNAKGKVVGDAISNVSDQATTTWTTDNQGALVIKDVMYNLVASDMTETDPWTKVAGYEDSTQFCLVETKAPAGYALSSTPILLTFNQPQAADDTNTVVNETRYNATAEVKNAKTSGILDRLPLTGGAGIWLIIALGLALAAASMALSRKKA